MAEAVTFQSVSDAIRKGRLAPVYMLHGKIAENVKIHPFAFIDKDVEIGPGCEIMPYASVMRGTRMGSGCRVFQGAIVGAEPQDFRWKGGFTYCHIGKNVTIREHVIINQIARAHV